jgi:hypothetical protein
VAMMSGETNGPKSCSQVIDGVPTVPATGRGRRQREMLANWEKAAAHPPTNGRSLHSRARVTIKRCSPSRRCGEYLRGTFVLCRMSKDFWHPWHLAGRNMAFFKCHDALRNAGFPEIVNTESLDSWIIPVRREFLMR